jgi:hypothetical protein
LFTNTGGLPPGGYIPGIPFITQPFPTDVPIVNPGQKIYVFLLTNENFKGNITFSKMTLLDKNTNIETELAPSTDFLQQNPNIPSVVVAPNISGSYEVRLYFQNMVAASESFEVTGS